MAKAGLDYIAIAELRAALSKVSLQALTKEVKLDEKRAIVQNYVSAPDQVAARARSDDETEFAEDVSNFLASWVSEWSNAGGNLSKAEFMIEPLLKSARSDRVAYERAKPAIADMVRGNPPEGVRAFIADDYSGAVNPKPKTRRTSPSDYFRQAQAVVAVHALKEAKISDRSARRIVAEASTALGIAWPEGMRHKPDQGAVSMEQIRNACRSPKFVKLCWDY